MSTLEKQITVYEAVLRLLEQGRDMGSLRVSEIAEEAGIGKGTIYEYFPSREELLEAAVLYQQGKAYRLLREGMRAEKSFDGRLSLLCGHVLQAMQRGRSGCCLLSQQAIPEPIRRIILEDGKLREERRAQLDEIMGYLTAAALGEHLIPAIPLPEYTRMVFIGCFAAFAEAIASQGKEKSAELGGYLRRMMLSSLKS